MAQSETDRRLRLMKRQHEHTEKEKGTQARRQASDEGVCLCKWKELMRIVDISIYGLNSRK